MSEKDRRLKVIQGGEQQTVTDWHGRCSRLTEGLRRWDTSVVRIAESIQTGLDIGAIHSSDVDPDAEAALALNDVAEGDQLLHDLLRVRHAVEIGGQRLSHGYEPRRQEMAEYVGRAIARHQATLLLAEYPPPGTVY